jgi:hypothetical protein
MKEKDLYYIAGFLDGEGSICIVKSKGQYYLQIDIVNTNSEVIDFVFKTLKLGGIYENRRQKRKVLYRWVAKSKIAEKALRLLLPYLKVKKEQAEIGLEFQSIMQRFGRKKTPKIEIQTREDYRQKIKLLNK